MSETSTRQEDYSLSEISDMTGHSRRSLATWLHEAGVPFRYSRNAKRFKMKDVVPVLITVTMPKQSNLDLAEAQARRMTALASLAEMKLARRQAEVIETGLARELMAADRQAVRDRLLRLPDELAPLLASGAGVAEVRTALMGGVVDALTELSEGAGVPRVPDLPEHEDDAEVTAEE